MLLIAQKDIANNYTFDQNADDIGFINDFIDLPTESLFRLDLFREKTNFFCRRTFQASQNRIGIGYFGNPTGLKVSENLRMAYKLFSRLTKNLYSLCLV